MASSEPQLLSESQVKKLSFKNVKKYVLSVGLELPKHVTKGNCLKLIFKNKKVITKHWNLFFSTLLLLSMWRIL